MSLTLYASNLPCSRLDLEGRDPASPVYGAYPGEAGFLGRPFYGRQGMRFCFLSPFQRASRIDVIRSMLGIR